MYIEPEWITTFYNKHTVSPQKAEVEIIIRGIALLFRDNDFFTVDNILRDAPTYKLSPLTIVTLARSTCNARTNLAYWNDFINRSAVRLGKLGKDPKKVLRGLL